MTSPRPHKQDGRVRGTVVRLAAVLAWLCAWQVAAALVGQPLILPGPVEVVVSLAGLLATSAFWSQVAFSAARILGALAAAYACTLALAAASRASRVVRELVSVPLSAVKATPVVCVVVLLLIWLGSANVSVAAVFLMALPGLYFPVLEGLDSADSALVELFDVHGVRGLTRALGCAWPRVLPYVVAASETVVGMSWKAGVAAELIGVPAGSVGERIYQAKLLLETGDLFAWTIAVVAIATACERVVVALLRASGPACVSLAVRLRLGKRGTQGRAICPRRMGTNSPSPCPCGEWQARDLVLCHGSVEPITYDAEPGSRVCVMAPSGTGKTTLLLTLARLEAPAAGECVAPAHVSIVPQSAALVEYAPAWQNVALLAAPGVDAACIDALFAELVPGIDPSAPVSELSGGQRRRVELARALVAPGDLVLLDEPFAGLDEATRERVCAIICRELHGRALVVATHDARDAAALGAATLELAK